MSIPNRLAILCAALLLAAIPARAQDPRFDPESGADLAHYPPPRHFDHLHMLLTLDIPDMMTPKLSAVERLTIAPIGRPRDTLILDADSGLRIASITIEMPGKTPGTTQSKPARFMHADDRLTITFPAPLTLGHEATVTITYSGEFPLANGKGLTWTKGSEDGLNLTARSPQIHSQGEPQQNHLWFPCHDFPNERLTTEIVVTVEDGFTVVSNGRLISSSLGTPSPSGSPRTTWHWLQDQPHANYLVSLVVGKFAIVGLQAHGPVPINAKGKPVDCPVYAPFGTEDNVAKVFARTPDMVAFFSEYFARPYPWDKYSQALVRKFAAGGMENTSATTLTLDPAFADPGTQDDLISHELCHQWTGDLITCKSWEHIWLNEGWASYAEALWAEHAAGDDPERARRAYLRHIRGFMSRQRVFNRTYAPTFPAMASNLYIEPDDTFMRPNDPYAKGALVLHMLRMRLGDEIFQKGVRAYINAFAFKEVETDDFRQALEEASGQSLEQFFSQWVRRPGIPRVEVDLAWTPAPSPGPLEGGGTLSIAVEQTQRVNAENPAYTFDLPFEVEDKDGDKEVVVVPVDALTQTAKFDLHHRPAHVRIDPTLTVASVRSIRTPLSDELGAKKGEEKPDAAPDARTSSPEPADQRP
jgi:aminopeptidase N